MDQQQWTREGPQPLGQHTREVVELWVARGWVLTSIDPDEVAFRFPDSFQGGFNPVRGRLIDHTGILQPLWCSIQRTTGGNFSAELETCGVVNGCPEHRTRFRRPALTDWFPEAISEMEDTARAMRAVTIAHCVLFGPCNDPQSPPVAAGATDDS